MEAGSRDGLHQMDTLEAKCSGSSSSGHPLSSIQSLSFDSFKPSKDKDVSKARAFDPLQIEEVDNRGLYTLKLSREAMFIND